MVVCRFYAQGNCRYGNQCRFEHVRDYDNTGDSYHYRSSNYGNSRSRNENWDEENYTNRNRYARNEYDEYESSQHASPLRGNSGRSNESYVPTSNKFAALESKKDFYPERKDQYQERSSHRTSNRDDFYQERKDYNQERPLHRTSNRDTSNKYVDKTSESVFHEIDSWNFGKQWVFSCYSPFKDCPNFPGFEDFSQEEMRWYAYCALKNGTSADYQNVVKSAVEAVQNKWDVIKRRSKEVMDILEQLSGGVEVLRPPFQFGNNPNLLTNFFQVETLPPSSPIAPTPSLFGGSAFVATQQPSAAKSLFGNQENVLAATPAQPMRNQPTSLDAFSFKLPSTQSSSVPLAFGQTPDSRPSFGGFQPSNTSSPAKESAFGSFPSSTIKQTAPSTTSSNYTPVTELSEQEKQQFMAKSFTLGQIPERPPPKEFCH